MFDLNVVFTVVKVNIITNYFFATRMCTYAYHTCMLFSSTQLAHHFWYTKKTAICCEMYVNIDLIRSVRTVFVSFFFLNKNILGILVAFIVLHTYMEIIIIKFYTSKQPKILL